jgi:nicotinamidase/pyrazinamidase
MTFQAPAHVALLNIDPQNGFCPNGNLAVAEGNQTVPIINSIRDAFEMVVFSQDAHTPNHASFASTHGVDPFSQGWLKDGKIIEQEEDGAVFQTFWPDHCVDGTKDAEFHPDLIIKDTDLIIKKGTNPLVDSYSAFYENDGVSQPKFNNGKTLTETFREAGITTIVMTGLAFDYCVGFSALDAVKDGFNVIVVKDATRGIGDDTDMTQKLLAAGVRIVNSADLPTLQY